MSPSINNKDFIIYEKNNMKDSFIKLNDIVVFKHPYQKKALIKRVYLIKNKSFFLLGDNRKESSDSREFGFIELNYIQGKVIIHIKNKK